MRVRLLLAACALLSTAPAATTTAATKPAAPYRVLCYGDSITAGIDVAHPESSYPSQLQRMRPDLEVVNAGLAGDVSDDLERFRQALAQASPKTVVLMLGANDAVCDAARTPTCAGADAKPERTAENLLRMAAEARAARARVLILTPLPVACDAACQAQPDRAFEMAVRNAFTERVAEELRDAHPPHRVQIADLRGKLTDEVWRSISVDGLHPSAEGNRLLAEFVSGHVKNHRLRHHHGGEERTKAATPRRRGGAHEADPFVRRPRTRDAW